jgi:methylated-DNA-[protein]-cysteine S-methyltransferase
MKNTATIICRPYDSPCGELLLGSLDGKLCMCNWTAGRKHGSDERRLVRLLDARFEEGAGDVTEEAARQLDEYFAGRRREFSVPLLFAGTGFQKAVWNELLKIPYGTTLSYGALAARLGSPKAVRAVANANGANALSIFAPCHRVIGTDGTLTGYGGGLPAKKALLELEKAPFRN